MSGKYLFSVVFCCTFFNGLIHAQNNKWLSPGAPKALPGFKDIESNPNNAKELRDAVEQFKKEELVRRSLVDAVENSPPSERSVLGSIHRRIDFAASESPYIDRYIGITLVGICGIIILGSAISFRNVLSRDELPSLINIYFRPILFGVLTEIALIVVGSFFIAKILIPFVFGIPNDIVGIKRLKMQTLLFIIGLSPYVTSGFVVWCSATKNKYGHVMFMSLISIMYNLLLFSLPIAVYTNPIFFGMNLALTLPTFILGATVAEMLSRRISKRKYHSSKLSQSTKDQSTPSLSN